MSDRQGRRVMAEHVGGCNPGCDGDDHLLVSEVLRTDEGACCFCQRADATTERTGPDGERSFPACAACAALLLGHERWHGTLGGYTNHKCRCDRCRTAAREYKRDYYRRHPEKLPSAAYQTREYHVQAVAQYKATNREGERRGFEWTGAELDFITARDQHGKYLRSAKSAALALNRSVLAVERARSKCLSDPRYIALLGQADN